MMVRTPVHNRRLDRLRLQPFLHRPLHQRRQLLVARKPQRHILLLGQPTRLRQQSLRKQPLAPQLLFQPDHTVLHLQRIRPRLHTNDQQRKGYEHMQNAVRAEVLMKHANDRHDERNRQHQHGEQERQVAAGMMFQVLHRFRHIQPFGGYGWWQGAPAG